MSVPVYIVCGRGLELNLEGNRYVTVIVTYHGHLEKETQGKENQTPENNRRSAPFLRAPSQPT